MLLGGDGNDLDQRRPRQRHGAPRRRRRHVRLESRRRQRHRRGPGRRRHAAVQRRQHHREHRHLGQRHARCGSPATSPPSPWTSTTSSGRLQRPRRRRHHHRQRPDRHRRHRGQPRPGGARGGGGDGAADTVIVNGTNGGRRDPGRSAAGTAVRRDRAAGAVQRRRRRGRQRRARRQRARRRRHVDAAALPAGVVEADDRRRRRQRHASLGSQGADTAHRRRRQRHRHRRPGQRHGPARRRATTRSSGTPATAATSSRARPAPTRSISTAPTSPRTSTSRPTATRRALHPRRRQRHDGPERRRDDRTSSPRRRRHDHRQRPVRHRRDQVASISPAPLGGAAAMVRPTPSSSTAPNGDDTVTLSFQNGARVVDGLAAQVVIDHFETADTLRIATLGGNDVIDASARAPGGPDLLIDGGAGSDTVSYAAASHAMLINLTGQVTTDGIVTDTLSSIENAVGSRFNDTIFGNDFDNGSTAAARARTRSSAAWVRHGVLRDLGPKRPHQPRRPGDGRRHQHRHAVLDRECHRPAFNDTILGNALTTCSTAASRARTSS